MANLIKMQLMAVAKAFRGNVACRAGTTIGLLSLARESL